MVDIRPVAGAPPHELAHSAPNGGLPPPTPPENNHHNQGGGSGDMAHGVASPAARASTPAANNALATYPAPGNPPHPPGLPVSYAPYYKSVGGVVWVPPAPLPPPPPPPPHHVNPHVFKSVQLNGADLPMNDIPTLRYYFNLGVGCVGAAYAPPPPPRHYSPRDMAQDMQQMSLHERGEAHKHKAGDNKPAPPPPKGNAQRSLLGPRFNKRGNQDGNQNPNHNQNKGHNNNNMPNKGPNNRRNSHESRCPSGVAQYGEGECVVEAPMVSVPYMPYPPPVYPIQYYPVDSGDPGMLGMMGGMGYVGYEEGGEYVQPYYPHPLYPHHPMHQEHK